MQTVPHVIGIGSNNDHKVGKTLVLFFTYLSTLLKSYLLAVIAL